MKRKQEEQMKTFYLRINIFLMIIYKQIYILIHVSFTHIYLCHIDNDEINSLYNLWENCMP